jgi:hypothetical protein
MTEFGHFSAIGNGIYIDAWGSGPFVIDVEGKRFRFEDSDRFGPALVTKNGDICSNPYPAERSPFWRAHRIWVRQGRRLADDKTTCLWDEPKPTTIQHMGGRYWMVVENGDEDGATIKLKRSLTSTEGQKT